MRAGTIANPPVSLGLPVYNGQRFVAQMLDSVCSQTFADFELVISDNASTDATEEICRDFARKDSRITYTRSAENRGAAWNHNNVIHLSGGEFFKWIADDDICAPTFLQRCIETFRSEPPNVVLVYPQSTVIDEHGTHLWEHWDGLDLREHSPHERLKRLIWNPPNMGTILYGMVRRSALRQTREHGAYPSADYVLLAELALIGEFREIPERLLLKRYHAGMSREANPSAAEIAEFLRPKTRNQVTLEYGTLFIQHLAAIAHVPMGFFERLRCYTTFLPNWMRVWWRRHQKEIFSLPAEVRRVREARRLAR
jgi:glycosyltransferase involved in cell wall biosynthesis